MGPNRSTPNPKRRSKATVVALSLVAAASLALPTLATGVTHGFSRVLSPASTSAGVGYGPGWVALTFDTQGAPHGPIIGYLLYTGVGGEPAPDHMDIYREHGPAASVPGPFAGGFASGNFDGCAWAYGGNKFFNEGGHHPAPCTKPPNHSAAIFCHTHKVDRLCNDGKAEKKKGETEPGVWKNIGRSYSAATVNAAGCEAFANVGSNAIYHGAAEAFNNKTGDIPAGTKVKVRFVTRLAAR